MTKYRSTPLRTGTVLVIGLILGACASTPHRSADKDQLVTTITATGQKQFTFIEVLQHSSGGGHGHRGMGGMGGTGHMGGMGHMGGGGMAGGRDMGADSAQSPDARHARLQEAVRQRLEAKLAATGYCRNGYQQLDSQFQHRQIQITGQCAEPATAEDRTRFPNPVP